MNVTFIGLGIMGSRMAANLLKNGVAVTVYNRSPAPVRDLESAGASAAASSHQAVQDADIVFTMLSNPEAVEQVALDETGFIKSMKHNALWVDCSTVNPSFSLHASEIAKAHGVRFVDAPVAGSKPVAESGDLVFLVGGDRNDVAEIEPLLDHMGSKIIHVGETGRGASFKMLVNALLAQSMLAFAETMALGEAIGLDKAFLLDTLPDLPVAAPFTRAKAEMIRRNDYQPQFPLELMHKDLHLAALTAYENNRPLPSLNTAKELYAIGKRNGLGREDFSAIYKTLRNE